ncbi:cell wall-binding repeat-containing protein [Candidatus Poriferisodalis sp.]|uniref:cell wall-binding repeat-containing protein n=1 Tax=Candidatus Poriferisodalis sp. TaxID=3101277 RepID=UPI003AF55591
MTTTQRRRGRRSLAAILAAMLMASVLAVVAGSPAHAANTSSEALVDHDDDADTPMVREFGGRDRYDTSLRLANNFGDATGLGGVPSVFVASGRALVDAVSVAGLAGFLDAPILLTPSDSLHGGVADFIEDYGVGTVYILGGAGAVSDMVAEDIEALVNEPTVSRIAGSDRYATAAAAAAELGGGAAWCGGEDPAALLTNGGDVSLVDAMMVGPIAHRLQLPLLLTAAEELPMATADFIEAEDIEHVVIVGGTDAVSDDVANALSDAGVDTVDRIAGDTPAGTSVELAGLLTGDCKDDLAPTSADTVALVSQDGLPDGVAAAPVLSSTSAGYDDGDLVPMLIVGDTLPAAVRDYLAATPEATAAGKLNLEIVAIGGTAAVSDSVMQAAVAAAASADALSVQIGNGGEDSDTALDDDVTPDDRMDVNKDKKMNADDAPQVDNDKIVLYFSDNVDNTDLADAIRDILEINGAPARLDDVYHGAGARSACDPDTVTVKLSNKLKAGDTVSVVAGAKLGSDADQRKVGATSVTIAAPPADRTRPTISVIMIAGRDTAEVTVSEGDPRLAAPATGEDPIVTIRNATAGDTKTVVIGADGHLDFQTTDANGDATGTAADLAPGDRVTIAAGAIVDTSPNKNKNLQRSFTAIKAQATPRITSVLMSNLNHSKQAAAAVPHSLTGGAGTAPDDGDATTPDDSSIDAPDIWIAAKADGAAAGAVGNLWSVVFDKTSSYDDEKDLDIDVRVNSRDRTVFVRFINGKATFGDLAAELEANSAFAAMFEVKVDTDPDTITGDNVGKCGSAATKKELSIETLVRGGPVRGDLADDSAAWSISALAGGETKVAIQVTFNAYISATGLSGTENNELLEDILAATAERAGKAGVVDAQAADATSPNHGLTDEVRADLNLAALDNSPDDPGTADTDESADNNYVFSDPGTTVRYEATTSSAIMLPALRDLVTTAAGASEVTDDPNTTEVETDARAAVAPVALGYADDATTTIKVDESMNTRSQVRIGRSSSVKAPQ